MSEATSVLPAPLVAARRAVRRRAASIAGLIALPPCALGALLAYRYFGPTICVGYAAAALLVVSALMQRQMRVYDGRWLLRRLNSLLPACEDSAELLLGGAAAAGGGALAALQRARLQNRLQVTALPELRPAYPRRALTLAWVGGALLAATLLAAPTLWRQVQKIGSVDAPPAAGGALNEVRLRIVPPAYTRLAAQDASSLDAKVPEGSSVAFALKIATEPSSAALAFLDGSRLELHRDAGTWRTDRVVQSSTLYRVQLGTPAGAGAAGRLFRLEVIPDRAPDVIVRAPERTLNLLVSGQKSWELVFEASDDYGLTQAQLSISLVQGSGENIKTQQRSLLLEGNGDAHHRVYRKTLELAPLGFAEGDDLIVRFRVSDNRPSPSNTTESASFILRWPAHVETASGGMEGLVQKSLPAYFASERQIIIDSEALQAQRGRLAARRFESRSDELGVEQRTLRLRYGEFLGEESARSAQHDTDTVPTSRALGDAGNVTSEYGHVHDRPEAATLLDPDTRRILKSALQEMWQAELHLRQADPDLALPYEYKALEYIKQVQQAERIYLARAGVQLPQIDASRRLTGDRGGLSDRAGATAGVPQEDSPVAALWRRLHGAGTPDWARFLAWARAHERTVPAALDLVAAADRLQRDPACVSCRTELTGLLWPLLPAPGTALLPRSRPDEAGAAYLEALADPSR